MDHGENGVDYSNEALRKLGARIRNLRRRRGLTQRDLSFDGCSYSYLARIEAGDRRPSPRVLREIAQRLNVTTEQLTGELRDGDGSRSLETTDAALLIREGRYDEAEGLLRSVLREAEFEADAARTSEAYEGLGIVAARRGDDESARGLLERALEAGDRPHPAHRVALYTELTRLYLGSGDSARAIALLEDALAALERDETPDLAKVVRYTLYLSQCHADAGDYGRASTLLAEALRDGVEEIDLQSRAAAYSALARLYTTTGETAQAMAYADRALTLYELIDDGAALSDAHLRMAQTLLDAGSSESAGRHLTVARQLLGNHPTPLDLGFIVVEEARHALQTGERELAAAKGREAVALLEQTSVPGQLGDAHLVLARVYDELGDDERAERSYLAAIEAIRRQNGWHRELAKAYRWYGKFLKAHGRADDALEALELAADLAPSNRDSMTQLSGAVARAAGR